MSCVFPGASSTASKLTAGLYYFTQSYLYLERRVAGLGTFDSTLGGDVDAANYAAFAQVVLSKRPRNSL